MSWRQQQDRERRRQGEFTFPGRLFACGLMGLTSATTWASQNKPVSQQEKYAHDGIRAAINHYFQGQATGDASHFRKAFLPTAHIEGMRDGKFTSWTLDEYCAFSKGKPADDENKRVRTIDFIDASGSSGVAKATLDHGTTVFTDYLILLKVGDEWKIANKVYSAKRKTAP